MPLAKKILGGTGTALALIAAVIVVRTVTFAPPSLGKPENMVAIKLPAYDLGQAAGHLGAAIRFQTVSHQNAQDNQPKQWADLHAWLQTTYTAAHAAMTRESVAGQSLIYTWKGTDSTLKPIILMAHQDVVPVTPGTEKDWKYPPFAGQVSESSIWGRGSVDDKGMLIGLMEATDALARSGFHPKRTIYIVSGHDEEVGGTGAKAAAILFAERGVKALLTVDEGSAVVLDEPVTNGMVALIGIAEKGYGTLKLTANAEGGHSSMPPKETGVINLAKALVAINDQPFPLEVKGPGAQMLGTLAATKGGTVKMAMANLWAFKSLITKRAGEKPSGAAMLHTTIAPTMLEGSPKENVLPQSANALINYRIASWNTSADVIARAKSAIGELPVSLLWVDPPREPSKVSSTTSQGWKYIVGAARPDIGPAIVAPYLVVAGTDSRKFEDVSDDIYRFMPMQVKLSETKMIHGTNEHLTLANLKRTIDFFARLIIGSAG
jgi:carboxypeptidase PM20D1